MKNKLLLVTKTKIFKMALLLAAALSVSAMVGGLATYSATKAFGENPTHDSVHNTPW